MKVYGKNVLNEVLSNPKKIKKLYMTSNMKDERIMQSIRKNKIQFESVSRETMDRMVKGNHQGIMAIVDDFNYADYKSMYNEDLVVVLDHLEDPHNFGAIIRTCECAGIKGIIIPKDRSIRVNETVMKISAGAINNVKIVEVSNLSETLRKLQKNMFFVYTADMDGLDYRRVDYADKKVLVIGAEGNGVSPIIRKNSDEIISIPMYGKINSLNASVSAAILIYGMIKE